MKHNMQELSYLFSSRTSGYSLPLSLEFPPFLPIFLQPLQSDAVQGRGAARGRNGIGGIP